MFSAHCDSFVESPLAAGRDDDGAAAPVARAGCHHVADSAAVAEPIALPIAEPKRSSRQYCALVGKGMIGLKFLKFYCGINLASAMALGSSAIGSAKDAGLTPEAA